MKKQDIALKFAQARFTAGFLSEEPDSDVTTRVQLEDGEKDQEKDTYICPLLPYKDHFIKTRLEYRFSSTREAAFATTVIIKDFLNLLCNGVERGFNKDKWEEIES